MVGTRVRHAVAVLFAAAAVRRIRRAGLIRIAQLVSCGRDHTAACIQLMYDDSSVNGPRTVDDMMK